MFANKEPRKRRGGEAFALDRDVTKVFLYAYPFLDALSEVVGVSAENKAALSYRSPYDARRIAETIVRELALSERLSALKAELDRAFAALTAEERFLLEYKYFRGKRGTGDRAEAVLACSKRTYFRMQVALLRKIACFLARNGWTVERFLDEFGRYAPFMRLLRRLRGRTARAVRRGAGANQKSLSVEGGDFFFPRRTNAAMATAAAHPTQISAIAAGERPPAGAASACDPDAASR